MQNMGSVFTVCLLEAVFLCPGTVKIMLATAALQLPTAAFAFFSEKEAAVNMSFLSLKRSRCQQQRAANSSQQSAANRQQQSAANSSQLPTAGS
jgi:hypothetical protein